MKHIKKITKDKTEGLKSDSKDKDLSARAKLKNSAISKEQGCPEL